MVSTQDFLDMRHETVRRPRPRLWLPPPAGSPGLALDAAAQAVHWEDDLGQHCLVSHVYSDSSLSPVRQLEELFERFEAHLSRLGFGFSEVVRTWFFLDEILEHYGDFNRIRTAFFRKRGLLGQAPASTAVGCGNDRHALVEGHLLAFRPKLGTTLATLAGSPKQASAFDYGSAFSRGITIEGRQRKQLFVSGTASIDCDGHTLNRGDDMAQVRETFDVVAALLAHNGYEWRDVRLATAYLPPGVDEGAARRAFLTHLTLPFASLEATVCRGDLLFELELMAEREKC